MQTSLNPADWHDTDREVEARRRLLQREREGIPSAELRQHYPFMARLVKRDVVLGMPVGFIFKYARTKKEPSTFPIEVYRTPGEGGKDYGQTSVYAGNEVELVVPEN